MKEKIMDDIYEAMKMIANKSKGEVVKVEFTSNDVPDYIEWFLKLQQKSKEHPLELG